MNSEADIVRVPKTAELVAGHLRREIIRGNLAKGDSLPSETHLMQQFGVSRPTLREAFRVLESEALIIVRRGARGGARVQTPDIRVAARYTAQLLQVKKVSVKDVYAARTILEPPAARMLAERPTRAILTTLEAALAVERDALGDTPAYNKAAASFHQTIVQLSGNETLRLMSDMLREIVDAHLTAATAAVREKGFDDHRDQPRAMRSHAKLIDLIRDGKGDDTESYWRVHMEAAGQLLLKEVGSRSVLDILG